MNFSSGRAHYQRPPRPLQDGGGDLVKTYGEGQITVRRAEMVGPKVARSQQKAQFRHFLYAASHHHLHLGRFEMKWGTSAIMAVVMVGAVLLLQAFGLSVTYLIFGALAVALALCWILNPLRPGGGGALIHDVIITMGSLPFSTRNSPWRWSCES